MRPRMPEEGDRCRLIGDIAKVLRDSAVPEETRAAGLTLIAWLARRMPGECASRDGVEVMVKRSAKLPDSAPASQVRRANSRLG